MRHLDSFGSVRNLTTPVFFYGLLQGQEIETDLEKGKTLIISLEGKSEPDEDGIRTVFFDLNGFPRAIDIADQSAASLHQRIDAVLTAASQLSAKSINAGVVAATGLLAIGANAGGFMVTNANDSGAGSLRQAVTDANNNAGNDVIEFDPVFFSVPESYPLCLRLI